MNNTRNRRWSCKVPVTRMSEHDAAVRYFVMTACNKNGYNRAEIYPWNLHSPSRDKVTRYHSTCGTVNIILLNTTLTYPWQTIFEPNTNNSHRTHPCKISNTFFCMKLWKMELSVKNLYSFQPLTWSVLRQDTFYYSISKNAPKLPTDKLAKAIPPSVLCPCVVSCGLK